MDIDSHLIKWRCELKFCQNCLCKGSFFLTKTKKLEVHLNPPFFFIFSLKPMHLRKWKTKLIIPIYFWTTTSKFCFKIISFSSLELSFNSNFDRARLKTVNLLLRALKAICNILSDGRTSLRTSYLYIRSGKLDTKWRYRQTKRRFPRVCP